MKRFIFVFALAIPLTLLLTACLSPQSDWARRDMPIDGLTYGVTYNLQGPSDSEKEVNQALLRGLNENGPRLMLETNFGKMSGSKTQDVFITQPDGTRKVALGMIKLKRFAGITRYSTLEPATYWAQDAAGNVFCGAKIRLDFNRNLLQYADPDQRDFQSLFYYDVPCSLTYEEGQEPVLNMDLEHATLRSLVLNEVWQWRVTGGSFFYNWGHSVTILDGAPTRLNPTWWQHWDVADTSDTLEALNLVNSLVLDLESSPQPWLEFNSDGPFADSWLTYSAADADRYATWDRVLLNRQKAYAVFYRPTKQSAWDYMIVEPLYNYEWNDVHSHLWTLRSWLGSPNEFNPYDNDGHLRTDTDTLAQVKEIERIGWMNAPNASLDQIRWSDPAGNILYTMTVRAHMGAQDTLVIFGEAVPDFGLRSQVDVTDNQAMPIVYDENGQPAITQPWDATRWADWQRENSFWNYLRDNPNAVSADLLVQYRFADNTEYAPIICHDSDGDAYTCGYRPVNWDLSTSYYMEGDPEGPWSILQTLGEVGVRTLGLSYVSGQYQGTGIEFAMDQRIFYRRYYTGFSQEDIWLFDARAMQLPDTLAQSWEELHR